MKNIKKNIPIITEENEKEYWIEYKKNFIASNKRGFCCQIRQFGKLRRS